VAGIELLIGGGFSLGLLWPSSTRRAGGGRGDSATRRAGGGRGREEEEEEVAPAVGEPQYGGTLTVFNPRCATTDPSSPDLMAGFWDPYEWVAPIQEQPLGGDFEKYGPRGTGESSFQLVAYIPDQFIRGELLESWEVSREKLVWHVRPGIMWQGRDIMESRELVADDVVADLIYWSESPGGVVFTKDYLGDIYSTGKYDLVIEFTNFTVFWIFSLGYEDRGHISPPETEGSKRWDEQVGTGPFMFKEYVIGSYMSYEKNPDYWKTTTINGKEYEIPFVDELIYPIIPDMATRIAAVRTGEVDHAWLFQVPGAYWDLLDEKAPGILKSKFAGSGGRVAWLKCDEPPFDDIEVRQAMRIGTDFKSFRDLQGVGPLPEQWWPIWASHPETLYTPLEKLPAETQLLFDYNPELAIDMLAKAGYPDGLKIEYTVPAADPLTLDEAALLKDMWAKIGVEVNIRALDAAANAVAIYDHIYSGAIFDSGIGTGNPWELVERGLTGGRVNVALWSDEYYDELMAKMGSEMDYFERCKITKEAGVYILNACVLMPLSPIPDAVYWWPWVKNYYGEIAIHDNDIAPLFAHAWLDQDLKAEMGY